MAGYRGTAEPLLSLDAVTAGYGATRGAGGPVALAWATGRASP